MEKTPSAKPSLKKPSASKTIRITCDVKDYLPLGKIHPFQGELKSLANEDYLRLRNEILETGFAFPIYIWRSPEKISYIIGGHQRVITLKRMVDDGYKIDKVPVVFIHAETIALAKRRILQDISQYGKVEKEGLHQFMIDNHFDVDMIAKSFKIPDIDMLAFTQELILKSDASVSNHNDEWVGMPEFDQQNKKSFRHLIVHFNTEEDAKKFFELIGQNDTGETKTVWFPPQDRMDTESKRYG